MQYLLTASVFSFLACISLGLYQEKGNPYDDGSLLSAVKEVNLDAEATEGLESDILILYPDIADTFGVFFFIGGLEGVLPANLYHTFLTRLAGHGFIVVGPWTASSEEPIDTDEVHTALLWAQSNLQKYTGRAKPDFNYLAVGGHSAGGNTLFNLLDAKKATAKAFVGMEPFSAELAEQVKFSTPGIFLGTELGRESCGIPGFGFANFYKNWKCPRIMAEVKGIGHCALMEDAVWDVCDTTGRCRTASPEKLPAYRRFAQGYAAAFLMVHVQGSPENLKYVTDRTLMPIDLIRFETDINCS